MKTSRWVLRSAVVTAVGLAAATGLPAGLASAQTSASATNGPMVKLIVAQKSIHVPRFGKRVFIDPGVFVVAVGSALRFNVRRASYAQPITNTQIIRVPGGGTVRRSLPDWTVKNWVGLHRFVRVTVRNSAGKIVASHIGAFCPNDFGAQRSNANAPRRSPFPQQCQSDPFQLANAWGIQRGWGVDTGFISAKIPLGKYTVKVNVIRLWQRFLHLTPRTSTATLTIRVVKPSRCGFPCVQPAPKRHVRPQGTLPRLPANVPTVASPPASSLPDLSPLPSWGIRAEHFGGKNPSDQVTFGATVWSGGKSRLDVEGFRRRGAPVMKAYQYFWKNGRIIGRARAGTMGFDDKPGHTHWHFEQFAQYRLLAKNKTTVVKSTKVGFCIAPTDPVNLLLHNALWQPSFLGFFSGSCGSQSALSVQEMMPIGWGDTYEQFLPGQAFTITNVPNGTYYIEIIANPNKVLHETNYHNNVSLRKIILSGTPGHRTVKVPAVHGIDPEHMG
ncbi:MAG: lysyl oxidase family protein [Streptosporangiaceae bacterium]